MSRFSGQLDFTDLQCSRWVSLLDARKARFTRAFVRMAACVDCSANMSRFRNNPNDDNHDCRLLSSVLDHGKALTKFLDSSKLLTCLQIYLHQLNPLIGPQINVKTIRWISLKWGDSPTPVPLGQ